MAPESVGIFLPELATPLPHRLVSNRDSLREDEFLDIAEAGGGAMVEPDDVCDDVLRESKAPVLEGAKRSFIPRVSHKSRLPLEPFPKLSMPFNYILAQQDFVYAVWVPDSLLYRSDPGYDGGSQQSWCPSRASWCN